MPTIQKILHQHIIYISVYTYPKVGKLSPTSVTDARVGNGVVILVVLGKGHLSVLIGGRTTGLGTFKRKFDPRKIHTMKT